MQILRDPAAVSLVSDPAIAKLLALRFELLWYHWRRETYLELAREDTGRINKIEGMLNQ